MNVEYVMIWWDAYGNPHQSVRMDKEVAECVLTAMHPSQEAQLLQVVKVEEAK